MATKKRLQTIRQIPDDLWEQLLPLLPPERPAGPYGRPPIPFRTVLNGILYVLRTGCQWKMAPKEFGSGSTLHRRFQEWERRGVFEKLWAKLLERYDDLRGIQWRFQSLDTVMVKAPLGGRRRVRTPPTGASRARSAMC